MSDVKIRKLWAWFPAAGITLFGQIFMKDPSDQIIFAHELVHVRQQRAYPIWFWVSYLFILPFGWNPWRTRWEAEACAVQARAGCSIPDLARALSGSLYLWPCRYSRAVTEITNWTKGKGTP